MDCHSNHTRWPWYGRLAPISWILSRDISRGRAKLDFSHWPYEAHTANQRMEICDAVSDGSMPLKAYTFMHHRAGFLRRMSTRFAIGPARLLLRLQCPHTTAQWKPNRCRPSLASSKRKDCPKVSNKSVGTLMFCVLVLLGLQVRAQDSEIPNTKPIPVVTGVFSQSSFEPGTQEVSPEFDPILLVPLGSKFLVESEFEFL